MLAVILVLQDPKLPQPPHCNSSWSQALMCTAASAGNQRLESHGAVAAAAARNS